MSHEAKQSSDTIPEGPDGFNMSATGLRSYYRSRIKSNTTSIDNSIEEETKSDERPIYSPATIISQFDDSSDASEPTSHSPIKAKPFSTSGTTDNSPTLPFTEGEGKTSPSSPPFHQNSSLPSETGTYSDGEMDWTTSTPKKHESNCSGSNMKQKQDGELGSYTWVAPDNDNMYVWYY